jgi:tyrosinase
MGHPSIAAFDPIFWFHHCNVDRIFAIWQALHPKAWFPRGGRDSKERSTKPESEKDLLPFYKFQCELGRLFYDSDWARDTESFGYTYPDLDGLHSPRTVWREVYNRYIWSIRIAPSSKFSKPPSDMMPLDLNKAQVFQFNGQGGHPTPTNSNTGVSETRIVYKRVASSGSDTLTTTETRTIYRRTSSYGSDNLSPRSRNGDDYGFPPPDNDIDPYFDREWYIDNVVKRNALNGPFTIYFFLCPKSRFPDHEEDYATSPYLAGINHVFAAPREVCDNCGQQDAAGFLASDTVPITPLLLDYIAEGTLQSMRTEHVRPFLVKYLRWRIVYVSDDID